MLTNHFRIQKVLRFHISMNNADSGGQLKVSNERFGLRGTCELLVKSRKGFSCTLGCHPGCTALQKSAWID